MLADSQQDKQVQGREVHGPSLTLLYKPVSKTQGAQ